MSVSKRFFFLKKRVGKFKNNLHEIDVARRATVVMVASVAW